MDSDGPVGDFRYQREANGLIIPKMQSAEETGNAARNPSAAEGGDGSGDGGGGGGGGYGGGGGQASVVAKIPPHLGQSPGPDSTGRAATAQRLRQENSTARSYDNVSMAMLSGDETDSPRLR